MQPWHLVAPMACVGTIDGIMWILPQVSGQWLAFKEPEESLKGKENTSPLMAEVTDEWYSYIQGERRLPRCAHSLWIYSYHWGDWKLTAELTLTLKVVAFGASKYPESTFDLCQYLKTGIRQFKNPFLVSRCSHENNLVFFFWRLVKIYSCRISQPTTKFKREILLICYKMLFHSSSVSLYVISNSGESYSPIFSSDVFSVFFPSILSFFPLYGISVIYKVSRLLTYKTKHFQHYINKKFLKSH